MGIKALHSRLGRERSIDHVFYIQGQGNIECSPSKADFAVLFRLGFCVGTLAAETLATLAVADDGPITPPVEGGFDEVAMAPKTRRYGRLRVRPGRCQAAWRGGVLKRSSGKAVWISEWSGAEEGH